MGLATNVALGKRFLYLKKSIPYKAFNVCYTLKLMEKLKLRYPEVLELTFNLHILLATFSLSWLHMNMIINENQLKLKKLNLNIKLAKKSVSVPKMWKFYRSKLPFLATLPNCYIFN